MKSIVRFASRWMLGFRTHTWHGKLRVFGSNQFVVATTLSLDLLEKIGIANVVTANLTNVSQGLRSTGYIASLPSTTYVVGQFSWSLSTIAYASLIAHHSFRRKVYEGVSEAAMVQKEKDCIIFQMTVLEGLEATDQDIEDAIGLAMSEATSMFAKLKRNDKTSAPETATLAGLRRILQFGHFRNDTFVFENITIKGNPNFVSQCRDALHLLSKLPEWDIIHNNIRVIRECKNFTHIKISNKNPRVFIDWPAWQNTETLAGILAHEAYHNHLYFQCENIRLNDKTGVHEERLCNRFQIQVLSQMVKSQEEIRALEYASWFPTHAGSRSNFFDRIWHRGRI